MTRLVNMLVTHLTRTLISREASLIGGAQGGWPSSGEQRRTGHSLECCSFVTITVIYGLLVFRFFISSLLAEKTCVAECVCR